MNKTLVYIYSLIMLESRINYEDASKIFNINLELLKENLCAKNLGIDLIKALHYLEFENNLGLINRNRSLFKARLLLEKFNRIIHSDDKKEKLKLYIKELEGHERFRRLFEKSISMWTAEEKEYFFKYKLKYSFDNHKISRECNISRQTITRWISSYEPGEFKNRILALNDFNSNCYLQTIRSNKNGR